MESVPTKACSDCRVVLPFSEFYRDKSRPDGHMYRCKACLSAYRAAHKDRIQAINRRYFERHADELRKSNRERHAENRDKYVLATRNYYRQNSKAVKVANAAWARANRVKVAEIKKMASHRRRMRMQGQPSYAISNKDLRRLLASPCAVTGCSNKDIQLDHVIPISRGGVHGIGNLQPLCKSHNSGKMNKLWIEYRVHLAARAGNS